MILTKQHNHLTNYPIFSLFSYLLANTNPSIKKGSILHRAILCMSVFFLCPVFLRPLGYSIRSSSSSQSSGAQHVNSPYTTYPVALHNNQAHTSKTMDIFFTALLQMTNLMAYINISPSTRNNFEGVASKKLIIFYLYFANFNTPGLDKLHTRLQACT